MNDYGRGYTDDEWDAIVSLMDDEIREEVHADLAPCTKQQFFNEYGERHYAKYDEPFEYEKLNPQV